VIPGVADRLGGAYPVLPTPFHDDQSLDLEGLGTVIDHLLARGVRGITVLGTGAERTYLSDEERVRVVEFAMKRVGGRASVLAGILRAGTTPAVEEGKRFRDLGVEALAIALPQYHESSLSHVIAHYSALVRDVGIPVLYHHHPTPTHLRLTPAQVGKLFIEVALVGIKNSSLDKDEVLAQLRAVGRPIAMFAGHSIICLPCLDGGAVGAICPLATLLPVTARTLVDEHRAGNDEAAESAQKRLADAAAIVMPAPFHQGVIGLAHAGVKEALVARKILGSSRTRDPEPALTAEQRERIRRFAAEAVEI
jgi:4-hydroxy-tetrahydrodipicolinate synthase